ncbi:MAG TPA: hypothetical protein VFQ61_33015 [Polyangiaceae bacterium]|nr:hypothetical protein [Polyangiaceae bacterium]
MRHRLLLWMCFMAACGSLLLGCARRRDDCSCFDEAGMRPVDPALLAFLSQARSAHRLADAAESRGDLPGAVRILEQWTEKPAPVGAPEVKEVQADTLARLADLESRRERFDRADASIERGLSIVLEPTYFRGRLYEVRGLIEERRAAAMKSRGDLEQAEAARQRALQALEMSMKIQSDVIEKSTRAHSKPVTTNPPADPKP